MASRHPIPATRPHAFFPDGFAVGLRFTKMHGLGNDFVVVDARAHPFVLDADAIRRMGDRHFGVGFDQLLVIENTSAADCVFAYRIWNADGSVSGQCGNGARCVAAWLLRDGSLPTRTARLQSPDVAVAVEVRDSGMVSIDMGEPCFAPGDVPFDAQGTTDPYPLMIDGREVRIGAVSIGNPHAVLAVDDIGSAPVVALGPCIESSARFPQRCNVGFAQIVSRTEIALRVWERGVGETLACGSGACAAVAVLRRRGDVDETVQVRLPGGTLAIHWPGPGNGIHMTGPAVFVFEGDWHGTTDDQGRP